MSTTTFLGVIPNKRPVDLAEWHNGHGWSASIWKRLLAHHGYDQTRWMFDDGFGDLEKLWQEIEHLPEWEQAPLVLTFDTGVIPYQAFGWAADRLAEFERRLPAAENHVNHVPAMIDLLRTNPEVPLIGVHGTSVSENPFDPWDCEADAPGSGIPLSEMYVLDRHQQLLTALGGEES